MLERELLDSVRCENQTRMFLTRVNYGWALAARDVIQEEMLSRVCRQGGLQSSHVGFEVHRNTLGDVNFSDFQNLPNNVEASQPPPYILAARMGELTRTHGQTDRRSEYLALLCCTTFWWLHTIP